MNEKLNRFVWSLLVCCLSATAWAQVPSDIVKSRVVTLDVASIERAANDGSQFVLDLGDVAWKVVLTPSPVWPKEGVNILQVAKDGSVQTSVVTGNITYAGDVAGQDPDASEVRLTIAGGAIDGYVQSNEGYWFIEPMSRFDPKAGPGQHLVYSSHGVVVAEPYHDLDIDEFDTYDPPSPPPPAPKPLVIVMAADMEYIGPNPESLNAAVDTLNRQTALVHMINGIYGHQIGRNFIFNTSIQDPRNFFLNSFDARVLKTQLKVLVDSAAHIQNGSPLGIQGLDHFGARIGHLTTKKNIFGENGSATAGIDDQAGRFSLTEQRFSALVNKFLASHEIGHNFNASHAASDYMCVNGVCGYTICAPAISSDTLPYFSDGVHGADKDNRTAIRNFLTSRGF